MFLCGKYFSAQELQKVKCLGPEKHQKFVDYLIITVV
jgi:hypothetical protein